MVEAEAFIAQSQSAVGEIRMKEARSQGREQTPRRAVVVEMRCGCTPETRMLQRIRMRRSALSPDTSSAL